METSEVSVSPRGLFGQGGKTARPIWDKFMVKTYADPKTGITKGFFKRPSSGVDVSFDCSKNSDLPDSVRKIDEKPWDIKN